MIRLITTRRLRRILGDYDRKATLNNDLLTELKDVTAERDVAAAAHARLVTHTTDLTDQGSKAKAETTARIRTLTTQRDQARAIAVDLEQRLAEAEILLAGGDTAAGLVRQAREQRDRMAALADTMQAAAEAADLPIGLDATVEDWRTAVKAAIEDLARQNAEAPVRPCDMCEAETANDPNAAKVGLGELLCGGCLNEVSS